MSEPELTKLQMDERKALTGDRAAILSVVSALRTYRIEADSLLTAFKELCRDHESQPEEFERAVRALEAGESP